jgi:hypothetical protein
MQTGESPQNVRDSAAKPNRPSRLARQQRHQQQLEVDDEIMNEPVLPRTVPLKAITWLGSRKPAEKNKTAAKLKANKMILGHSSARKRQIVEMGKKGKDVRKVTTVQADPAKSEIVNLPKLSNGSSGGKKLPSVSSSSKTPPSVRYKPPGVHTKRLAIAKANKAKAAAATKVKLGKRKYPKDKVTVELRKGGKEPLDKRVKQTDKAAVASKVKLGKRKYPKDKVTVTLGKGGKEPKDKRVKWV